jgi:hypothetical protein
MIILLFFGCKKENDKPELATDYIAHFPFNGNANDESPNKNHGIVNGATLTPDRKDQANSAYYFDGSSDISIPNAGFFDQLDTFCISVWVNPSEVSIRHNTIICKVEPSRHFLVKILKDNMKWEAHFAIDTDYYRCYSADTIELNKWTHILYQWTGSKWQFYKNGNFVTEEDYSGTVPPTGGTVMNIGSMGGSYNFTGKIDDIRIYNRTLTKEEIEFLFKN